MNPAPIGGPVASPPIFNPNFQGIGEAFVKQFYMIYDDLARKAELVNFYQDSALLTFEGDQQQGREAIMKKHMSVQCQTAHAITRTDCQPTADGGVLVVVLGQLKTEGEERPLGFNHTFTLKDMGGGSFCIANEIFQLLLHNF